MKPIFGIFSRRLHFMPVSSLGLIMDRRRPFATFLLVVTLASAAVMCFCVRMQMIPASSPVAGAAGHSCCSSGRTPVQSSNPLHGCDRCEYALTGGMAATITLKAEAPQPQLAIDFVPYQAVILTPSFSVATVSFTSRPSPLNSLVALHCQMST